MTKTNEPAPQGVAELALAQAIAAVDAMTDSDLEQFRMNFYHPDGDVNRRGVVTSAGDTMFTHSPRRNALQRAALINLVTQAIKGEAIRPTY